MKKFEVKNETHIIVKIDDILKYLKPEQRKEFLSLAYAVTDGRIADGKPMNKYYICNTDEPYATDVFNVIKTHQLLANINPHFFELGGEDSEGNYYAVKKTDFDYICNEFFAMYDGLTEDDVAVAMVKYDWNEKTGESIEAICTQMQDSKQLTGKDAAPYEEMYSTDVPINEGEYYNISFDIEVK